MERNSSIRMIYVRFHFLDHYMVLLKICRIFLVCTNCYLNSMFFQHVVPTITIEMKQRTALHWKSNIIQGTFNDRYLNVGLFSMYGKTCTKIRWICILNQNLVSFHRELFASFNIVCCRWVAIRNNRNVYHMTHECWKHSYVC